MTPDVLHAIPRSYEALPDVAAVRIVYGFSGKPLLEVQIRSGQLLTIDPGKGPAKA